MKGRSKSSPGTRAPMTLHPKDCYGTPMEFYAGICQTFRFTLDAAADAQSAKCERFITAEEDALVMPWLGVLREPTRVYCNPPYSSGWKEAFCQRAINQVDVGNAELVAMLLPANTADGYWRDWVWPHAAEILHVQGRLAFTRPGLPAVGADFPSAVVIYRPHFAGPAVGMINRQGRLIVPARPA